MKFIWFFLLAMFVIDITSCGKPTEAAGSSENKCGFRYVSGQRCIVCDKGGISCDWSN
jgi:hypothetical protein